MNLFVAAKAAYPEPADGVPVFLFHRVNPLPPAANWPVLYVSPEAFRALVRGLAENGVVGLGLDQALAAASTKAGTVCAITFDDGFRSVLEHAGPVLAEAGFVAINYLVANRLGRSNEWDLGVDHTPESLMDRCEVEDWLGMGHEIGAHTLTHPHLDQISLEEAREEVGASKRKLEDLFGREVRHFAYPWGERNAAVVEMVQAAGYVTACTTEPGMCGAEAERFNLPRFYVDDREAGRPEPFSAGQTRAAGGDGT